MNWVFFVAVLVSGIVLPSLVSAAPYEVVAIYSKDGGGTKDLSIDDLATGPYDNVVIPNVFYEFDG